MGGHASAAGKAKLLGTASLSEREPSLGYHTAAIPEKHTEYSERMSWTNRYQVVSLLGILGMVCIPMTLRYTDTVAMLIQDFPMSCHTSHSSAY